MELIWHSSMFIAGCINLTVILHSIQVLVIEFYWESPWMLNKSEIRYVMLSCQNNLSFCFLVDRWDPLCSPLLAHNASNGTPDTLNASTMHVHNNVREYIFWKALDSPCQLHSLNILRCIFVQNEDFLSLRLFMDGSRSDNGNPVPEFKSSLTFLFLMWLYISAFFPLKYGFIFPTFMIII